MTSKNIRFTLKENFHELLISFLVINLLFFSSSVQSAEVFRQSPLDGGDGPASFFEEHSADNFLLPLDTEITGIQWWGSFFDETLSNNNFDIRFFNDNAGLPSNTAFQQFSVTASRSPTALTDFFGADVFLFETSFPSFNLMANTTYHVSIVHPDDVLDDEFYWLQNDTTGSNFTRNINPSVPNDWETGQAVSGNLAFALQGNQTTPIPEPDTLVLLVLAFLGMSFRQYSTKS